MLFSQSDVSRISETGQFACQALLQQRGGKPQGHVHSGPGASKAATVVRPAATPARATFSSYYDGHTLTIKVQGVFDFMAYKDFRACYEKLSVRVDDYVLDLAGVSSMDSSGLAMLLLLRDHAGGDSERVHLVRTSPFLFALLQDVNFDSLFSVS